MTVGNTCPARRAATYLDFGCSSKKKTYGEEYRSQGSWGWGAEYGKGSPLHSSGFGTRVLETGLRGGLHRTSWQTALMNCSQESNTHLRPNRLGSDSAFRGSHIELPRAPRAKRKGKVVACPEGE